MAQRLQDKILSQNIHRPETISPPARKPKPGYVYVLNAIGHDYYKIGLSVNVPNRTKSLERQYPFEIEVIGVIETDDMHKLEKKMHNLFSEKNCKGEWFILDEDDLEKLDQFLPKTEDIL